MSVQPFVVGNKTLNILVCLDLSRSMNFSAGLGKIRPIDRLNKVHEAILDTIARHGLLRSSVSIGFLIDKGKSFDRNPFGDASCSGLDDGQKKNGKGIDKGSILAGVEVKTVKDIDKGSEIDYCLRRFKIPLQGFYGCTSVYGMVDMGLADLEDRLSSDELLPYVSYLIVISDGRQNNGHENGQDTINHLTRCLKEKNEISRTIVPLFIDVGTGEDSPCLKELSNVFPAGYIKYKEKINFNSIFTQVFLSARRSANAQGGKKFMLDMIEEKLKNG